MSKHYIQRHYGDHCFYGDNAWKRSQRYDATHGDNIMIFNYGCSGYNSLCTHSFCGGTTFWGGFGAGLGHGLANLFSGFLGGFMGWSGFGSFGGFGGFMPFFNQYGLVPNYIGLGGFNTSSTTTTTTTNTTNTTTSTPQMIEADTPLTDETDDSASTVVDDDKNNTGTPDAQTQQEGVLTEVNKLIDNLGSKSLDKLSEEDLVKLRDNIDKLDGTRKDTLRNAVLKELEPLKVADASPDLYKCSRDFKVLLMLEMAGVNVQAEHWVGNGDQWIKGPISNVQKDTSGNITYNIDCSETGDNIKAIWTFEHKENGNTCKPIKAEKTANSCNFTFHHNVEYKWDDTLGCWINHDKNKPSATKDK